MADHVTIDTARLRQTGRALDEVAGLLRSASTDARSDGVALAQRDLVQAMETFVGNWRIHRERLVETLEGHRRWIEGAAESYESSDRAMAEGLAGPPSHG